MRRFNKRTRKRRIYTLVVVLTIVFCLLSPKFLVLISKNKRKEVELFENKRGLETSINSGKIHIKNNWSDAVVAGIATGSGTFSDPYVIKDLIIDGGGSGVGILIERSKNFYFRIENCTIINSGTGIRLKLVNNGTIYRNNISFNTNGIYVSGVSFSLDRDDWLLNFLLNKNNTILENVANNNSENGIYIGDFCNETKIIANIVNNNKYGINLLGGMGGSQNIIIINNTANDNYIGIFIQYEGNNSPISHNILYNNDYAIYFFSGLSFNLTGNLMRGSGLSLGSTSIEGLSLLKIDTSNLVNSKHIYYYINKSNLKQEDFLNAGQIFLINSHNSIISNLDVSYSTTGISLFHSNNITVINTNSSNNTYGFGVWLFNTNNSNILGNTLNLNNKGIKIDGGGKNNTISGNFINNNWEAIELRFYCDNNIISDNHVSNNFRGIMFHGSSYNTLSGNIFKNTIDTAIYLIGGGPFPVDNNTFFLNFFRENGLHVEISGTSINSWNITEIGNYWDNYTGVDANGDGIGDIPYNISLSPLIQDFLPIVDNDPPEITIFSPSNNSVFGNTTPSFEIEVNEKYLDIMWYTLDDGLHNYTFIENGTIDQTAWGLLPNGQVRLRFYAVDKVGNIAYQEVLIIKQKEAAIPGYNPLLLLGIIILFCFTLIKIVSNKGKKIKKKIG